MTEIRQLSTTNHGLFATKEYKTGDIILSSAPPLIRLAPASNEEEMALVHTYFPNAKGRATDDPTGTLLEGIDIDIPDGGVIPSSSSAVDVNRSRKTLQSMVQVALCYVHASLDDTDRERLLSLYHPPIDSTNSNTTTETTGRTVEEQMIVQLSSWALAYLKRLPTRGTDTLLSKVLASDNGELQLQKVMLIWACNSFASGRIYDVFSRVNHSCNPNSVIAVDATNEEHQLLRAATCIQSGEEISISYLDSWLYTDTPTRQAILERDKFFTCRCERCLGERRGTNQPDSSFPDAAQSIPCPVCHPRIASQQLPEDVQYDDDLQVHYVCPWQACPNCGFAVPHQAQTETASAAPKKQGTYDKLLDTNTSVVAKVVSFLHMYLKRASSKRSTIRSLASNDESDENKDDLDACEIDVRYEQLTQHLTLASSVLGARHWTTNLIMLHLLDQSLAELHSNMLTNSMDGDNDDEKEATMETIASAIDMLERILRFVNGQNLNLHMGHLLSNVVVGTARALVSLGDVKSQKYAADWVSKLTGGSDSTTDAGFVHFFESPGLQKVVETLKSAWQRHPDSERPEKRIKR